MKSETFAPSLFLASQSPRRKQILEGLGLKFRVLIPPAEEAHPDAASVEKVTQQNASLKASSVLEMLKAPTDIVIGADTLVVLGDEVLGKPKDAAGVHSMLSRLSGATHTVFTGLSLLSPKYGQRTSATKSLVTFRKITESEMDRYAGLVEPYDKAGSYAVQGVSCLFIEKIEGSYTNVMGLPSETFLKELEALTKISVFDFFEPKARI